MQATETNVETKLPNLITPLPGPKAKQIVERDAQVISPSYTRDYPLVAKRGHGAVIEDVDGNSFLDFAAGIAVVSTGHCHPGVVAAIQKQASELIHMSGTDFYYPNMVELAEKLASIAPGKGPKRVYFGNSGAEAVEAAIKLAKYHTKRDKLVAFHGAFMDARWALSRSPQAEQCSARGLALSSPVCFTCPIRTPIAALTEYVRSTLPPIAFRISKMNSSAAALILMK